MWKLLRFVGTMNAAVWLGSAVFVTVGLPVVFSPEVGRYIQRPFVGIVAETILARYSVVQYWCAGIALLHLACEYFMLARRPRRFVVWILLVLSSFALLSGLWVQPKMQHLHNTKYWGKLPADREEADKSFRSLHGGSQAANLLVIVGLVIYVWNVTEKPNSIEGRPRFSALSKFRS
jgi:hypothetical protein